MKKPQDEFPVSGKSPVLSEEARQERIAIQERERAEAIKRWNIAQGIQRDTAAVTSPSSRPGFNFSITPPPPSARVPYIDTAYERGIDKDSTRTLTGSETKGSFKFAKKKLKEVILHFSFYNVASVFEKDSLKNLSDDEWSEHKSNMRNLFLKAMARYKLDIKNWEEQIKSYTTGQILAIARELNIVYQMEVNRVKKLIKERSH